MRLSKTTVLPAAALALAVSAQAGQASILLDFTSSQPCVNTADPADITPIACSNAKFISQNYGDVSGQLDVVWDSDLTLTAI